jgi:hypothetical protein
MSVYAPPPAPSSIKEAGVGHKLLFDLLLKLMHVEGLSTVTMLAARSRLPAPLLADLVEEHASSRSWNRAEPAAISAPSFATR